MNMGRDLQDSLWVTQTTEMTGTTRGCLIHPLLIMDAMTIRISLEGEMTVEVVTTVDRDTMAAEGMTVAEGDGTTASVVEIIGIKGETIVGTAISIAMVEGREEVREMTIEGDQTQL